MNHGYQHHTRPVAVLLAVTVLTALVGCASNLPSYPTASPRASLDAVAHNMQRVRSLRAKCDVGFTDAAGESIRFDAAVVAVFPDRFRVQAWKFDRAVVDVTCLGGEVFTLPDSGDTPGSSAAQLARQTPARIARSLAPFTAEFWLTAEPLPDRCTPTRILARSSLGPGSDVLCVVDRATLVPIRFEPWSPSAERTGEYFALAQYRLIEGIPWPTVWEFGGPSGGATIRLADIELNTAIEDEAFVPPKRAVKLP